MEIKCPYHLSSLCSALVCEVLWKARSLATRSVESWAAFTASCFGITRRDWANSAMANCSLLACRKYRYRFAKSTNLLALPSIAVIHSVQKEQLGTKQMKYNKTSRLGVWIFFPPFTCKKKGAIIQAHCYTIKCLYFTPGALPFIKTV